MLFMVIERFRTGNGAEVYARYHEKGRMLPEGATVVGSWLEPNEERCFQVMECDGIAHLYAWAEHWFDLVDFQFIPVVTSDEMLKRYPPK